MAKKVVIPIGCRSDAGLSAPIIKRLHASEQFDVYIQHLHTNGSAAGNFKESYNIMDHACSSIKPDLVLCVGDRVEMCAAACAAFHNGVKIAHVYAGVVADNERMTYDEIDRHCISLWADICFCEDFECADNIAKLWALLNKFDYKFGELTEFWRHNIHIVGITHMDDVITDESLVPPKPYDLILLNNTIHAEDLIFPINDYLQNPIVIASNPDKGFNPLDRIHFKFSKYQLYGDLPRGQFLGLLKHCARFITNSSSGYYEAPFYLKPEQIIWVGQRNKRRREYKRLERGASDKIVKILEKWASPFIIAKTK